MEKIETYLFLARIKCPVLKSVLIDSNEIIDPLLIEKLKNYFNNSKVTVRYQYIKPSCHPIQGGNKYNLEANTISKLQNPYSLLWILEPINRLENKYGINLHFKQNYCTIEIVGKGFDVSDLNRGQVSPHEIIYTELPIRKGEYCEWWKFLHYKFCSQSDYETSKKIRLQKLKEFGFQVSDDIFEKKYHPLSMDALEELLRYITSIHKNVSVNDFCVSCSIVNNQFVFWDIQTPQGKKHIYGA